MSRSNTKSRSGGKVDGPFANRADGFVNRARELRLILSLPIIALVTALLATISGAFQTGQIPLLERLAFWLGMMACSTIWWLVWFVARVETRRDWWPAAMIGMPLYVALLPFQLWFCLRMIGVRQEFGLTTAWLNALGVGVAISIGLVWRYWPFARAAVSPAILRRHGIEAGDVLAVSAEDHYCRIHLAAKSERLIHARFSDVVAELAHVDGAQIHRSAWIAAAGVCGARRAGRSWELILPSGKPLRVSATYRELAKKRGWLDRKAPSSESG